MARGYYANQTDRTLNIGDLPTLSEGLESYRAFQWEVEITLPAGMGSTNDTVLTLAAKQVTQLGFTSEDIVADRVNDKFYYPGKVTPEEVTITFDNLVRGQLAETLFNWMSTTYDPINGVFTPHFTQGDPTGGFKTRVKIYQLDNTMTPVKMIYLYGAYPKSWKTAEFNYATNEFHTIELALRYDFAVQYAGPD